MQNIGEYVDVFKLIDPMTMTLEVEFTQGSCPCFLYQLIHQENILYGTCLEEKNQFLVTVEGEKLIFKVMKKGYYGEGKFVTPISTSIYIYERGEVKN